MPPHQGCKSLFRAAFHVLPQQAAVIHFLHSPLNAAAKGKVTIFFIIVCQTLRWGAAGEHGKVFLPCVSH
jgi:hypothetical protein